MKTRTKTLLTGLTASAALAAGSASAGVIAYWSFDSGLNADIGGFTSTQSGTTNVVLTADAPGVLSNTNSASFTTTSSLTTNFDAATEGVSGNPSMSISLWFKATTFDQYGGIFSIGSGAGSRVEIADGGTGTGNGIDAYYGNGNAQSSAATYGGDNTWHHFVLTYNGGHDTAKIYIDGADVTGTITNGGNELNLSGIATFNHETDSNTTTTGTNTVLLSDVAIWDEVISETTAAGLANGTITIPEPGSLALLGLGGLCMLKRRRRDN